MFNQVDGLYVYIHEFIWQQFENEFRNNRISHIKDMLFINVFFEL